MTSEQGVERKNLKEFKASAHSLARVLDRMGIDAGEPNKDLSRLIEDYSRLKQEFEKQLSIYQNERQSDLLIRAYIVEDQ